MFEALTMAPPDPILGLTDAFKKDPNPEKINLGVGVYLDENGKVPLLATVAEAARRVVAAKASTTYLPMTGMPEYNAAVQDLVLGKGNAAVAAGRARTAQTPGGTGALRVAADFIKRIAPSGGTPTIWVSDETWANHQGIFAAAGLDVRTYPYYNAKTFGLEFDAMLGAIGRIPKGDAILLHGACHNPTGLDPSCEQWVKIADAVAERSLLPLIDFAYQGLGDGIEEDAAGVREFTKDGREALIASSFSKNFSLYNERVGALTLAGKSGDEAEKAYSHLTLAIRTNYSNPPRHGAALVTTVLSDADLRKQWVEEVAQMRARIKQMRVEFVEGLKKHGVTRDFGFLLNQKGMFSYSGLTPDQVGKLKEKYAIYIVKSGRINVAGMTPGNLDRLCAAIAEVLNGG